MDPESRVRLLVAKMRVLLEILQLTDLAFGCTEGYQETGCYRVLLADAVKTGEAALAGSQATHEVADELEQILHALRSGWGIAREYGLRALPELRAGS